MIEIGISTAKVFERIVAGKLTYFLDVPLGSGDTSEAADRILKTVNQIAGTTGPATKQASGRIGGAMLDLAEKQSQNQFQTSMDTGVRAYARVEDIEDPDVRKMFERFERGHAEYLREMKSKPHIFNLSHELKSGSAHLLSQMDKYRCIPMSFTTGRFSSGRVLNGDDRKGLDFLGHFEAEIAEATTQIRADTNVIGDLVVKDEGGFYHFGTFEARDKLSGHLVFSSTDDGLIRWFDKGVVVKELDLRMAFSRERRNATAPSERGSQYIDYANNVPPETMKSL